MAHARFERIPGEDVDEGMTREQAIDQAVRRSMKRSTMASVLNFGGSWETARIKGKAWSGHPMWHKPDAPFHLYPRRLAAIRAEFRRIMAQAAE